MAAAVSAARCGYNSMGRQKRRGNGRHGLSHYEVNDLLPASYYYTRRSVLSAAGPIALLPPPLRRKSFEFLHLPLAMPGLSPDALVVRFPAVRWERVVHLCMWWRYIILK